MNKLILDQATLARLPVLDGLLEVCDESGRTLGYFSPVSAHDRGLYDQVEVPVSEKDVQRLLQQPAGRPLAEILADLETSRNDA